MNTPKKLGTIRDTKTETLKGLYNDLKGLRKELKNLVSEKNEIINSRNQEIKSIFQEEAGDAWMVFTEDECPYYNKKDNIARNEISVLLNKKMDYRYFYIIHKSHHEKYKGKKPENRWSKSVPLRDFLQRHIRVPANMSEEMLRINIQNEIKTLTPYLLEKRD